jgi:hypothetical protein
MLPVIERFVLAFVTYKLVKTIRLYKQNKQQGRFDFFTTLKRTCDDMLAKVAVVPVVTEIAVLYYGFIN